MKASSSTEDVLPSLDEVRANAAYGAMTTSMRIGWEIAADAGLINEASYRAVVAEQVATLSGELAPAAATPLTGKRFERWGGEYRAGADGLMDRSEFHG